MRDDQQTEESSRDVFIQNRLRLPVEQKKESTEPKKLSASSGDVSVNF